MTQFASYVDSIAIAMVAFLLLGYHAHLHLRLKRNPDYTIQAVNRQVRAAWVEAIMAVESRYIVGVQTLRNSTMAATFKASTAILLIIGTLNLSGEANKLVASWHVLNMFGSNDPTLWMVKILLLVTDFFVAFFGFAMSVRLYNHVGFYLSIPPEARHRLLSDKKVAIHLNRAGFYYSIGMRAYYVSIPLVFWLFGPVYMLVATGVLIYVMYLTDRNPDEAANSAATV